MARLVILLGPPASGKTTLGRVLGERDWRFSEWEVELLETWGNRENLVAHETEALAALHQRIRDLAAAPGLPVVFETTGLSDVFLDQIVTELPTFVVRLYVGLNEARRRARQRPRGEHLADDDAATYRIWNEFATSVARLVDLVIDSEKVALDRAADLVIDAVDRRPTVTHNYRSAFTPSGLIYNSERCHQRNHAAAMSRITSAIALPISTAPTMSHAGLP